MKKRIIFKTISAAVCACLAVMPMLPAHAAYVQNSAAAVSASAGFDLIKADTEFTDGMEGWTVSGGSASVSDEAISISASGDAAISTDIGGELYKSASASGAIAWDFEGDGEVAEDITLAGDDNLGKWSTVRPSNMPCYTESIDDVEPYNVKLKEEVGEKPLSDATYGIPVNWNVDVTELIPPEGSKRCLTVYNVGDKPWKDFMGVRVKLSKDMLKVGEEYTLSFWMMESTHRRSIYCGRTPYDEGELQVNTDSEVKNGVLDYTDWKYNLVEEVTIKQWRKYSISFTPAEEEFNADGYTTLWIITTGKHKPGNAELTNRSNIFKYEKFYFDNIFLERTAGEPKTTNYRFGCKVKGDAGTTVTAKAVIDGKDTLFETTKTLDENGVWESLTADIAVGSDIPYLSGSDRGSCFAESDPRVKLYLQTDGNIQADDIHITESISGAEIGRYAGRTVIVTAEVSAFEDLTDVTAECKAGGRTVFEGPVEVKKGMNSFSFKGVIPAGADGLMTLDMRSGSRSIFDKDNNVTLFFKNGANVYPDIKTLKSFGAGQYLVEFDVAGGADGDKATVTVGGVTGTAEVFGGVGLAELRLTEADVTALADTDEITVNCGKTVSNITVKKVSNVGTRE